MEKLQIHYYLENDVHYMDAIIKNRSETELIKLIKHVAFNLGLEIEVESEALDEGGIKEYFRISFKKKSRKKIQSLIEQFGIILVTVLTTHLVENTFEDKEVLILNKEETRLNIEKLKLEIDNLKSNDSEEINFDTDSLINYIESDGKTIILKSNFYSHLVNEGKLFQISAQELSYENKPMGDEKIVNKSNFKKFIVKEIELEPRIIMDVEIEIISPVFKKGNDNWKGVYNGEAIDFKIGDPIFKQKVLGREVSFSTGTKILCELEIRSVLDKKGEPKIKSRYAYNIIIK